MVGCGEQAVTASNATPAMADVKQVHRTREAVFGISIMQSLHKDAATRPAIADNIARPHWRRHDQGQ